MRGNGRFQWTVASGVGLALLATMALGGCGGLAPAKTTPWLATQGNRIVLPDGTRWMGRGVNLHDTRSCKACAFEAPGPRLVNEVKRRVDFLVEHWGVNLIRLNLESYPPDDREVGELTHYGGVLDDPGYFAEVVDLVRYIGTKPGVYVLLSLWHEPSFDQRLAIPTDRTRAAWQKLAGAFARDPHVIFGVANEPRGENADDDALVWEAMNRMVAAIRAIEARLGSPQHLVAVQGTRGYGRDLRYYLDRPITAGDGRNVVYEVHLYNPTRDFAQLLTAPSRTLPVIIGEFGPVERPDGLTMTLDDCGQLVALAEALQVPWAAWTFHARCPPGLIEDDTPGQCGIGAKLRPTPWGERVRHWLER